MQTYNTNGCTMRASQYDAPCARHQAMTRETAVTHVRAASVTRTTHYRSAMRKHGNWRAETSPERNELDALAHQKIVYSARTVRVRRASCS